MTQQQTERDDALIAEKKRLADRLEIAWQRFQVGTVKSKDLAVLIEAAALLRGDEPAKPDRYLQVWEEAYEAYCNKLDYGGAHQAAAAVLRKHFEPSAEVVEALERLVAVIKMAGVGNLSRGVQLGQISWSVKCSDAIEWAEKALSQIGASKEPSQ